MDRLDKRWLYLALFLVMLVPFFLDLHFTAEATKPVRAFYDRVEAVKAVPGRLVIVAIDWDPQSKAELYPQTKMTIKHLMLRKKPFAVVTLTPLGRGFCNDIPAKAADEIEAEFGWRPQYGRDWVNWGYKYGWGIFIKELAASVPQAVKTDVNGTPIGEVEVMKGVEDASSIDLVCEFTGFVGLLEAWLSYFQVGGRRPDFCHGCTAVSGPSNYVFLDSEQITGLLVGLLGGAEYENLLGVRESATAGMRPLTTGLGLIVLLIVLGNVSDFVLKRRKAVTAGGEAR
jgi:hypothetical protein